MKMLMSAPRMGIGLFGEKRRSSELGHTSSKEPTRGEIPEHLQATNEDKDNISR